MRGYELTKGCPISRVFCEKWGASSTSGLKFYQKHRHGYHFHRAKSRIKSAV
jgi:hypothetical protein